MAEAAAAASAEQGKAEVSPAALSAPFSAPEAAQLRPRRAARSLQPRLAGGGRCAAEPGGGGGPPARSVLSPRGALAQWRRSKKTPAPHAAGLGTRVALRFTCGRGDARARCLPRTPGTGRALPSPSHARNGKPAKAETPACHGVPR